MAATFLDFAQAGELPNTDSKSIRALLEGRTVSHRDQVMTGLGKWRCTVTASKKVVKGYKDEPDFMVKHECRRYRGEC